MRVRTEYERSLRSGRTHLLNDSASFTAIGYPAEKTAHDAIDLLRIPYVPYWSFGEPLPVIEEGTRLIQRALDMATYEILARVLATRQTDLVHTRHSEWSNGCPSSDV